MKRTRIFLILTAAVLVLALLVCSHWPAIIQRGDPVPYLAAAVRLSEQTPVRQVYDGVSTYITRLDGHDDFIQFVEDATGMVFTEQAGAGHIFTDGVNHLVFTSEVYWGHFLVWSSSHSIKGVLLQHALYGFYFMNFSMALHRSSIDC